MIHATILLLFNAILLRNENLNDHGAKNDEP